MLLTSILQWALRYLNVKCFDLVNNLCSILRISHLNHKYVTEIWNKIWLHCTNERRNPRNIVDVAFVLLTKVDYSISTNSPIFPTHSTIRIIDIGPGQLCYLLENNFGHLHKVNTMTFKICVYTYIMCHTIQYYTFLGSFTFTLYTYIPHLMRILAFCRWLIRIWMFFMLSL